MNKNMCYGVLILLLFISWPASAQNAAVPQADTTAQRSLVRDIRIEGFVLGDREQFVKLFKPYRNKYLSAADMDAILQQIQEIYEQGGYQELVSIEYRLNKKRLTFTVSLIK